MGKKEPQAKLTVKKDNMKDYMLEISFLDKNGNYSAWLGKLIKFNGITVPGKLQVRQRDEGDQTDNLTYFYYMTATIEADQTDPDGKTSAEKDLSDFIKATDRDAISTLKSIPPLDCEIYLKQGDSPIKASITIKENEIEKSLFDIEIDEERMKFCD
jgi:hypothetical protein